MSCVLSLQDVGTCASALAAVPLGDEVPLPSMLALCASAGAGAAGTAGIVVRLAPNGAGTWVSPLANRPPQYPCPQGAVATVGGTATVSFPNSSVAVTLVSQGGGSGLKAAVPSGGAICNLNFLVTAGSCFGASAPPPTGCVLGAGVPVSVTAGGPATCSALVPPCDAACALLPAMIVSYPGDKAGGGAGVASVLPVHDASSMTEPCGCAALSFTGPLSLPTAASLPTLSVPPSFASAAPYQWALLADVGGNGTAFVRRSLRTWGGGASGTAGAEQCAWVHPVLMGSCVGASSPLLYATARRTSLVLFSPPAVSAQCPIAPFSSDVPATKPNCTASCAADGYVALTLTPTQNSAPGYSLLGAVASAPSFFAALPLAPPQTSSVCVCNAFSGVLITPPRLQAYPPTVFGKELDSRNSGYNANLGNIVLCTFRAVSSALSAPSSGGNVTLSISNGCNLTFAVVSGPVPFFDLSVASAASFGSPLDMLSAGGIGGVAASSLLLLILFFVALRSRIVNRRQRSAIELGGATAFVSRPSTAVNPLSLRGGSAVAVESTTSLSPHATLVSGPSPLSPNCFQAFLVAASVANLAVAALALAAAHTVWVTQQLGMLTGPSTKYSQTRDWGLYASMHQTCVGAQCLTNSPIPFLANAGSPYASACIVATTLFHVAAVAAAIGAALGGVLLSRSLQQQSWQRQLLLQYRSGGASSRTLTTPKPPSRCGACVLASASTKRLACASWGSWLLLGLAVALALGFLAPLALPPPSSSDHLSSAVWGPGFACALAALSFGLAAVTTATTLVVKSASLPPFIDPDANARCSMAATAITAILDERAAHRPPSFGEAGGAWGRVDTPTRLQPTGPGGEELLAIVLPPVTATTLRKTGAQVRAEKAAIKIKEEGEAARMRAVEDARAAAEARSAAAASQMPPPPPPPLYNEATPLPPGWAMFSTPETGAWYEHADGRSTWDRP